MGQHSNTKFASVLQEAEVSERVIIDTSFSDKEFKQFQWFLVENAYYTADLNSYAEQIQSKEVMLEALYYSIQIPVMFSLNWDAFQEGMERKIGAMSDHRGMCILIRMNTQVRIAMQAELDVLESILFDIEKTWQHPLFVLIGGGG